jgi:hypothetical protein
MQGSTYYGNNICPRSNAQPEGRVTGVCLNEAFGLWGEVSKWRLEDVKDKV